MLIIVSVYLSLMWLCLCAPSESPDVHALFGDPGSQYWVRVLEQTQRRGTNTAGVQCESVKSLKSKNQTKLSGSTPAACPYYQAAFSCEKCHYSTQERGGRELAVATMEALCVLWDLARKVSGTRMNSPLPGVEGSQGVMRPSRAEMAAQYSSSSRQPAQAVERSVMSNYVLCYNTATQGGLNGSFQLLPDCCCVNRSKDPLSWHSNSLPTSPLATLQHL